MKRNIVLNNFLMILMIYLSACDVDKEGEFENLKSNIKEFNDLRLYLENKYADRLSSNNQRLVFLNCVEVEHEIKDYVCNDNEVLKRMDKLGLKEVRFERKSCGDKSFGEVYFQKSKFNHYPIVYYLYEECGAGKPTETPNIYYQPVNEKWGLLVDSSYP